MKPSALLENTVIQGGNCVVGFDAMASTGYLPKLKGNLFVQSPQKPEVLLRKFGNYIPKFTASRVIKEHSFWSLLLKSKNYAVTIILTF
jgi:hypothetical protein